MNKEHVCECGKKFAHSSGLSRHKKACHSKPSNIPTKKRVTAGSVLEKLQRRIDQQDMQLREKDDEIKRLNQKIHTMHEKMMAMMSSEMKDKQETINQAGTLVAKSMSTMDFLMKHMSNAPTLKPITVELIQDIQEENGDGDEDLVDLVLHYHRHGTLHEYLGNIVVAIYKKDNPSEQSMWNTDNTRLTYFIKDIIGDDAGWISDKRGLHVKDRVIMPMLRYIKRKLHSYCDTAHERPSTEEHISRLEAATDLLGLIGLGQNKKEISELGDRVNKHIAGHFYLDKSKALKMIRD